MGGDGESNIRADMRHLAAFVRDPNTVVSCILLPFSCSMHLEMQVRHHSLRAFKLFGTILVCLKMQMQ